jgi:LDH2 family malate/lactate/ureidoglycolate dehydrogenase
MKLAIEKAKKVGMAFVSVRNSNHFGIAGYYTKMACDEGLVGIATTNTQAIMVPTNGAETILGTNPLAFAMPAEPYPFWFDASTTVVPRGKLEVYNKEDKEMPAGWGVGADGQVSTDAEHVLHCIDTKGSLGGILPLGGATEDHGSHKGYGYAMVSELFSSIFSFGHTSNHHVRVKGQGAGTCHGFMVIDPKIFGDAEEMKRNMSVFLQELRDSKRADPNVPVYTHGEKEMLNAEKHMREGIEVNIHTVGEMKNLCLAVGMDPVEYLGDVDTSHTKASIYDNLYK